MSFKTLICASFLVFLPVGAIGIGPVTPRQKVVEVKVPARTEKVSKNGSESDSSAIIPAEFKQYEPDTQPLKEMVQKIDSLAKASEQSFKENNVK